MCGIAGIWQRDGRPVDRAELDRFTDALAHRGPDGRGIYVDPETSLGLGHRRLAILDTSPRGEQPKSFWQKRYWITFNGEIFNFLDLRRQLIAMGYRFTSETDSEVVLAAYHAWGEDCQLRFQGMWAFAIWDSRRRELFLSRDRFGVKPLFYFFDGKRFCFASELKAFLHLGGFSLAYDPRAVVLALEAAEQRECSEYSMLEGVKNLRGGFCMRLEASGAPRPRRWWNTLDHLSPWSRLGSKSRRLRELLSDATVERLTSDVPVAATLSGGLDSSSILCSLFSSRASDGAAHPHRAAVKDAFIATYEDPSIDEFSYAQQVLEATGVRGHLVRIDPAACLANIEKIVFDFEGFENVFASVWLLYQAIRAEGIKVTLDGHGSDELFAGYEDRYEPLLRTPRSEWRPRIRAFRDRDEPWWEHPDNRVVVPGRKECRGWVFHEPHRDGFDSYRDDLVRIRGWHPVNQQLYIDFHMTTLPKILRNFDRLSMAHGVEVREPFLDWRLVCFATALSHRDKLRNGRTKHLLRAAMKGILPESVRMRTSKRGFNDPWFLWLRGPLKPLLLDTIHSARFLESSIWDGIKMRNLALEFYRQNCPAEQRGRIARVWRCVQAQMLFDSFAKAREPQALPAVKVSRRASRTAPRRSPG